MSIVALHMCVCTQKTRLRVRTYVNTYVCGIHWRLVVNGCLEVDSLESSIDHDWLHRDRLILRRLRLVSPNP